MRCKCSNLLYDFKCIIFAVFFFNEGHFSKAYGDGNENFREVLDQPVVISLSRCKFRYDITEEKMYQAGFTNIQRFEAIDGIHADEELFDDLGIFKGSPGQKGCAASHLLLWKEFSESPNTKQFLFVCEDDMLPHSKFLQIFPVYWEETPKSCDLIMVGNQVAKGRINHPKYRNQLILKIPSWCTHAYIISKEGAKKLYELYRSPNPSIYKRTIDQFLISLMKNQLIDYCCYNGGIYPDEINLEKGLIRPLPSTGICFQNLSLDSTIAIKK